jgi:hypothetical protein
MQIRANGLLIRKKGKSHTSDPPIVGTNIKGTKTSEPAIDKKMNIINGSKRERERERWRRNGNLIMIRLIT